MPKLLVFQHLVTLYLGGIVVRVVSEIECWNAQECTRKQRVTTWSCGWLLASSRQKQHTCQACQKLKRHASWSTTRQNRTTGCSVISRLDLTTQSSRELALFWKTWLFTFHSHPSINTPYTHERKRASREKFERKTLEKNKIDSSPIFIKRLDRKSVV